MAAVTFPLGALKALATVTKSPSGIYLLSMHSTGAVSGIMDNRLTPDFISTALLPALDYVEFEFRKSGGAAALVFTGEREKNKFFSNGLQLEEVATTPHFFRDYYYKLMSRIATFPMYTVCAINGHYYAGGFCLAQCADWRIVKNERAWGCMNEVDFGAPLPIGMAAVLNNRLSVDVVRKVMLTGHKFTAPEALAAGIVDEVVSGDGEAVIARALEVAELRKGHSSTGVLGLMKERLYATMLDGLKTDEGMTSPAEVNDARLAELQAIMAKSKL